MSKVFNLPDVQKNSEGFHKIYIDKVGVRNIQIPIKLKVENSDEHFSTIATVSSYCNLNEDLKGINMSRIGRTIYEFLEKNTYINFQTLEVLLNELQINHNTNNIYIKLNFEYIFKNKTPISNISSFEPVNVTFECIKKNDIIKKYMTIKYIGMSLCPCSKEMSLLINNLTPSEERELSEASRFILSENLKEKIRNAGFGAHNQKSEVEITVEVGNNFVWIEDIVDIINKSTSSPVWSILKREDEKYVTELSYMNKYINEKLELVQDDTTNGPKFVEDISRDIAYYLNKMLEYNYINDYIIIVNNQESIHSNGIVATSILNAGLDLK